MYKKYHTNLCCINSLTIACNVFHKENNNNNDNILSLVWDLVHHMLTMCQLSCSDSFVCDISKTEMYCHYFETRHSFKPCISLKTVQEVLFVKLMI